MKDAIGNQQRIQTPRSSVAKRALLAWSVFAAILSVIPSAQGALTNDSRKHTDAALRRIPDLPGEADYKITYKKCTVMVDDENNLSISNTNENSSIKIKRLRQFPKNIEPKEGKYFYLLGARVIPFLTIEGAFGKIYTEAEISRLVASGGVKAISTKAARVAWVDALRVGSIKSAALVDATVGNTASCSIMLTGWGAAAKMAFSGIIVENIVSNQPIRSLSVASKAYRNLDSQEKTYSLGGVGAINRVVAQAAGLANVPVRGDSIVSAPAIATLTGKGAPLTPDTINSLHKRV